MPISTGLANDNDQREALMLEPLTELERGILEYLIEYLRQNTYQPSIREIGKHFDIKSTKSVAEYLQSLADKGWIERDPARSRGIRILGLELKLNTIAIPIYETTPQSGAPATPEPIGQLSLDQTLSGSTRAYLIPMPDDTLADSGIHEGDLLLVAPTAPEDLDLDDVVVTTLAGDLHIFRWDGHLSAQSPGIGDLAGRVTTIIRRLLPLAPATTTESIELDAHSQTP